MKYILFTFVILFLITGCNDVEKDNPAELLEDNITISGQIQEKTTGIKLPYGKVHLLPPNRIEYVDSLGFFSFDSIELGLYRLIFECPFYITTEFEINVQADTNIFSTFSLEVELDVTDLTTNLIEADIPYIISQPFLKNSNGTLPDEPLLVSLGPKITPQPLPNYLNAFDLREINLYFQNSVPPDLLLQYGTSTSCDIDVFGLGLSKRIWKRLGKDPPSWAGCWTEPSTQNKMMSILDLRIGSTLAISDTLLIFGAYDVAIQPYSLNANIYSLAKEGHGYVMSISMNDDSLFIYREIFNYSQEIVTWNYEIDIFTTDENYHLSYISTQMLDYHVKDLTFANGLVFLLRSQYPTAHLTILTHQGNIVAEFDLPRYSKKIKIDGDTLWLMVSEQLTSNSDTQFLSFYQIDISNSIDQSELLITEYLINDSINTKYDINFDYYDNELWISEGNNIYQVYPNGEIQYRFSPAFSYINGLARTENHLWVLHSGGYAGRITKFRLP